MDNVATILVVDDTSESLALIVRILSQEGFHVLPADSGELALAAITDHIPDLILLDIRLKGIDGLEVCRRLKSQEKTRNIPIILISAFSDVAERVAGLELGAVDYVTKPFESKELLIRIRLHIALSQTNHTLKQQTIELAKVNEQLNLEITERNRIAVILQQSIDRAERSRHALLGTLEDQKRTQQGLHASEQRFRSFIENANDVIYVLNLKGVFTYISPNWLELIGEPAETALNNSFESYIHPDDLQRCREALNEIFATGKQLNSVEYQILHRDGTIRWHSSRGSVLHDEAGNITGYLGIARDITELKQVELKLSEQLDELRRWQGAMLGREDRIRELKHEINLLLAQNNQPARYPSVTSEISNG